MLLTSLYFGIKKETCRLNDLRYAQLFGELRKWRHNDVIIHLIFMKFK